MDETHLDRAHAAMEAGGESERLRFYETLVAAELFLLLDGEAEGDQVAPQAFEVDGQAFVLAFDTEERLAGFAGREAHYVALSGRAAVEMLAEAKLGLGLNLEAGPSEMLLPPEAMVWLVETLGDAPKEVEAKPQEIYAPVGLPESLVTALDARLAAAEGLAEAAYLVGVSYESGAKGHLLGFVDAHPGADGALARAVSEVLQFSGMEAAMLDVGFFQAYDQICARMALVGLRFDLPKAELKATPGAAPGMNPDLPPKLR
ncbi:SseB family protein [Roseovarius phycicola]|uniref:SseB family protein n=1 Tax=Roseovarius phycicola TaxID=3080976 RepID=A0ABZ2HQ37_9RHOB